MIVGTAGHVDHGKTSLVKALTGVDTDRLPEEKRRGITIELGFAELTLPDGQVAGLVDVPGHERFVRAMAAGAGGVNLALLVIALDEGVMPQTREHLDICRLLGVRASVIALTKADLLPTLGQGWLELLKSELRPLIAGTPFEAAEIIPCSAQTGEGIEALRQALGRAAKGLLPRATDESPLLLPVDRAFSVKGFGAVLTGSVLSGRLALEASVSLLPGLPGPFRVRGLQVHGKDVREVRAGSRAAVNLSGLEAEKVPRGSALVRHQELPLTQMLDVELELLASAPVPLRTRSKLLLHLGTAQLEATVQLLEQDSLAPGGQVLAQLRLASPVAALPGQRFILRGSRALPGRGATVAGGRVLALASQRRRRRRQKTEASPEQSLRRLAEGVPEVQLLWLLAQAGYSGLTEGELFARSALPARALRRTLELLATRGEILWVDRERRLCVSAQVLRGLALRATALLEASYAQEQPREGLPLEELRVRLSPELSPRLLTRLVEQLVDDGIAEQQGELLALKGRKRALPADAQEKRQRLLALLEAGGLGPPTVPELSSVMHLPEPELRTLLALLVREGQAQRVSEALYFHASPLAALQAKLVEQLRLHGEISTQAFKELTGQSRKYVIPLSEYFDREKVTLRVGDKRTLRKG